MPGLSSAFVWHQRPRRLARHDCFAQSSRRPPYGRVGDGWIAPAADAGRSDCHDCGRTPPASPGKSNVANSIASYSDLEMNNAVVSGVTAACSGHAWGTPGDAGEAAALVLVLRWRKRDACVHAIAQAPLDVRDSRVARKAAVPSRGHATSLIPFRNATGVSTGSLLESAEYPRRYPPSIPVSRHKP